MQRTGTLLTLVRPGTLALLGMLLFALLAACSDGSTPPETPVAAVEVAPDSATVVVAETRQLTATLRSAGGDTLRNRIVTWSSSDTLVAKVSVTGLVTARAAGPATIIAASEGRSALARITVVAPNPLPTLTTLTPSTVTAGGPDLTLTLSGAGFVSGSQIRLNGAVRPTTFVSATELRAELTTADIASAGAYPVAVVNPAPGGGESQALTFTVAVPAPNPVPTLVEIIPNSISAGSAEQQLTISGSNFVPGSQVRLNGEFRGTTFVSASSLLAAIPASDLAEEGMFEVRVVNPAPGGGISGVLTLTISPMPVATVSVSPPTLSLDLGEQATLAATLKGADGRILTGRVIAWTSADPATVSVDSTGKVIARREGTTTIFAVSETKSGPAEITVRPAPVASVTLSRNALALETGSSQQLTATLRDASGRVLTGRSIQWSSSAPGVASVSGDGLVSAQALGRATITAESGGKSSSASVEVESGPAADLIYNTIGVGDLRELYILDLRTAGAPPQRMDAGGTSRDPTASPDGNRIAFVRETTDPATQEVLTDIYAMDRGGPNLRRLTTLSGVSDDPAWTPVPGANRIAFRHWSSETRRSDIWVMDADGANPRNLTGTLSDGVLRHSPAWSPDGQWIAFAEGRAAGNIQSLWIMRANGTDARQLTSGMMTFISHPSWSPDGERIAFSRFSSGDADISIIDLDGGAMLNLGMPGHQRAPAWSPDGRHIAFAHQAGASYQIYTIRPDGTDLRQRTTGSTPGGDNPAWIRRQ